MKYTFDRLYWEDNLKHPEWYIRIEKELKQDIFPIVHSDRDLKAYRNKIYELVEEMLRKNQIPLATSGPNFDKERKPVNTIIIHHSEEEPDIRLGKLSAIGFVRQYGLKYLSNDVLGYRLKGKPIWSNHFRNGKMVFFAYHWLIRPSGKIERLLEDTYIGWQSGNWEINTRSVAISLSGDYENSIPPLSQIEGAAKVIKKYYPFISLNKIFGHREVKTGRTCPGGYFLSDWKQTLLSLI